MNEDYGYYEYIDAFSTPDIVYRNRQHRAAMMKSISCWTDDQIEFVRIEWPKGRLSSSQIGSLIGKTRNAVIGKVHRLGLAQRRYANQHKRANGENKQPPKPRKKATPMVSKPKPPRNIEGDVILNRDAPISIDKLNAFTCRAPAGHGPDGLMTYCGNMVFPDKVFCEGHCAMFYVPSQARTRWH